MNGFEVKLQDMGGDEVKISTDLIPDWRKDGAIAYVEINEAGDKNDDGPIAILNRDQLVALRAAIDMILNADEFRQSPAKKFNTEEA
jgi:hypothetical protein